MSFLRTSGSFHFGDALEPGAFDIREHLLVTERCERIPDAIDFLAAFLHEFRVAAEFLELRRRIGCVRFRHYPVRGALEQVQFAGDRRELRGELHGARSNADDPDPFAGDIVRVVPACGMPIVALEVVDTGNARPHELVEHANCADDDLRAECPAVMRGDVPHIALVTPMQRSDAGAEPDMSSHVVLVGDLVQVFENFSLAREWLRPVDFRFEGERIEVRLHVAFRARIAVPEPRAADTVTLLEDHVIVDPGLIQMDPGTQAGGTGADDDDAMVRAAHGLFFPRACGGDRRA